jgi:hypothetical protein
MAGQTIPLWVKWAHQLGFITRYEAHGAPGNWLDLYADADVPETEMFYQDRDKLVSKFASSAAHIAGKPLVGAETGTWLKEHFTGTLADMKYLVDDMFLSGANHLFYHGTCYSPDEAAWPGWEFYASFEMNPRNPVAGRPAGQRHPALLADPRLLERPGGPGQRHDDSRAGLVRIAAHRQDGKGIVGSRLRLRLRF